MIPDLTKITEIFLLASSFLVAALGTADTNYHKAAVSLLGLIISVLWWPCSNEAYAEAITKSPELARHMRYRILSWFAPIFVGMWSFSSIGHLLLALHVITI